MGQAALHTLLCHVSAEGHGSLNAPKGRRRNLIPAIAGAESGHYFVRAEKVKMAVVVVSVEKVAMRFSDILCDHML